MGGLEELVEIDNVFMEYHKTLFNESASSIQRLVHGSDVNKKLDEAVKTFLVHLSPYFLLRPAQKSLEWLIYRSVYFQYYLAVKFDIFSSMIEYKQIVVICYMF